MQLLSFLPRLSLQNMPLKMISMLTKFMYNYSLMSDVGMRLTDLNTCTLCYHASDWYLFLSVQQKFSRQSTSDQHRTSIHAEYIGQDFRSSAQTFPCPLNGMCISPCLWGEHIYLTHVLALILECLPPNPTPPHPSQRFWFQTYHTLGQMDRCTSISGQHMHTKWTPSQNHDASM